MRRQKQTMGEPGVWRAEEAGTVVPWGQLIWGVRGETSLALRSWVVVLGLYSASEPVSGGEGLRDSQGSDGHLDLCPHLTRTPQTLGTENRPVHACIRIHVCACM